jgi:periplasmic mercuric ion binding protein
MKSPILVWLAVLLTGTSLSAMAQKHPAHLQKKEKITVPGGSCDACKKTIENAARSGGAHYAKWNMESKVLTVSYDIQNANSEKIQQRIAHAGFDTPLAKANPKAYQQLEGCCKYDRKGHDNAGL